MGSAPPSTKANERKYAAVLTRCSNDNGNSMSKRSVSDAFFNLADALTEDIVKRSDEELLAEVAEEYDDPTALSIRFDKIVGSISWPQAHYVHQPEAQDARLSDLKRYLTDVSATLRKFPEAPEADDE